MPAANDESLAYVLEDKTKLVFQSKSQPRGTTNEEVLKVLIDRINKLNDQLPCDENQKALTYLNKALNWLDLRSQARLTQAVKGTQAIHQTAPNYDDKDTIEILASRIESIRTTSKTATQRATTDDYMQGMANGLILALALIDGVEPKYIQKVTNTV